MGMQGSRSLIAGYPFEGTGADVMQVNNGAWVGNEQYDTGICGKAAKFDGASVVLLGNDLYNFGQDDMAVAVSVRFNSLSGFFGVIGKTAYIASVYRWYICFENPYLIFYIYNTSYFFRVHKDELSTGEWYRLVMTKKKILPVEGTLGYCTVSAYINGVLAHTSEQVNYLRTSNYKTMIGAYPESTGQIPTYFMNGLIENVKIYNKALTQSEIQRDYLNLPIF